MKTVKKCILLSFTIGLPLLAYIYLHDPQQCNVESRVEIASQNSRTPAVDFLTLIDSMKLDYIYFPDLHEKVTEKEFYAVFSDGYFDKGALVASFLIERNHDKLILLSEKLRSAITDGVDFRCLYPWAQNDFDEIAKNRIGLLLSLFRIVRLAHIHAVDTNPDAPISMSTFLQFIHAYSSGHGVQLNDVYVAATLEILASKALLADEKTNIQTDEAMDRLLRFQNMKENMKMALENEYKLFEVYRDFYVHGNFLYKKNTTRCRFQRFIQIAKQCIDQGTFDELNCLRNEIESEMKSLLIPIHPNKKGIFLLHRMNFDCEAIYNQIMSLRKQAGSQKTNR